MPISSKRRHYLTMPDEAYKKQIEQQAKMAEMTLSAYIISRLELLNKIETNPVGRALVTDISNGRPQ